MCLSLRLSESLGWQNEPGPGRSEATEASKGFENIICGFAVVCGSFEIPKYGDQVLGGKKSVSSTSDNSFVRADVLLIAVDILPDCQF